MARSIDYRNSVVLFSGGMDSTVSLFYRLDRARREGGIVNALTISYGQRHSNEVRFARMVIDRIKTDDQYNFVLGKHWVHKMHFPAFPGSLLGGAPVVKYENDAAAEALGHSDNSFVPYRNLAFLTLAAQYAWLEHAGTITTGLRGGFEDCTADFERKVQNMLNLTVWDYPLHIDTPTHQSREDTLVLASTIPGCMEAMQYTLTCFEGTTPPCGQCLPCLKRAQGFAALRMSDPVLRNRYTDGMGPPPAAPVD